jgi:transcriptional regulator GlxA family with amidase domain
VNSTSWFGALHSRWFWTCKNESQPDGKRARFPLFRVDRDGFECNCTRLQAVHVGANRTWDFHEVPLATANDLSEGRKSNRYDVTLCGLGKTATTTQGLRVPLSPVRGSVRPDVVIVPALGCKTRETILAALERRDVADACDFLRAWIKAVTRVAGACTATFVLAASGVLDGGMATTTWWLSPVFRERFPHVALDDSRMIAESGRVVTAGAALAHVDLALWLVRQRSPSLAQAGRRACP